MGIPNFESQSDLGNPNTGDLGTLDNGQRFAAMAYNRESSRRLGWSMTNGTDPGSAQTADVVFALQSWLGQFADGKLGDASIRLFRIVRDRQHDNPNYPRRLGPMLNTLEQILPYFRLPDEWEIQAAEWNGRNARTVGWEPAQGSAGDVSLVRTIFSFERSLGMPGTGRMTHPVKEAFAQASNRGNAIGDAIAESFDFFTPGPAAGVRLRGR